MRKIAIILSGLLCCLFYETGSRGIPASVAEHAAVTISVDRASHDQWRCEREYNADLNLPRVAGEVSPAPVVPVSQRGGSGTGQNADRFAANRFEAGVVKVTSEFKSSDLSVGLHAVDYYVYRLRRLIS